MAGAAPYPNRRLVRAVAAVAVTTTVGALLAGTVPATAEPVPPGISRATQPVLQPPAGQAAVAALRARHGLGPPPRYRPVVGRLAAPLPHRVVPDQHQGRLVPVAWPAAGSVTVALQAGKPASGRPGRRARPAGLAWVRAGRLPVWVAPAASGAGSAVSRVRVTVEPRRVAAAAGAAGMVLTVRRADGRGGAGRVRVRVSYRAFALAGGGFGPRLALFRMPGCALTSPRLKACRSATPIPSVNIWRTRTVSAVVAAGPAPSMLAMDPTLSSGIGDFRATSLLPSSQWQVGLPTGDFSWSYPLRVPPPIAGSAPQLALAYDSGQTDGETAQSNTQPGQLGEGFSLTGGGFIEQRYASCGDIIAGKIPGAANDTGQPLKEPTGDECWDGQNAYVDSAGHSGPIIQDAKGKWHLASDNGSTVTFVPGTTDCGNHQAYTGSYWEIIAADGTQYFYGLNKLPGYQSGNTQTGSVWTVPVFSLASGDPCNTASSSSEPNTYSKSYATMPWRWNLDLVVDPNGNATSYYYSTETNYYATASYIDTTTDNAVYGTVLPYTSGGTLTDIWYGMQDDSSSSPDSGGDVYAHKAFNVHLTWIDRCTSYNFQALINNPGLYSDKTVQQNCEANENSTSGDWQDTPWDANCASASGCTGPDHDSPAFFDTQMLGIITTTVEQGFNTPETVDTWTLGYAWQSAPATPDEDLTLATIAHQGNVGGTITLASVMLGWTFKPNRVTYDSSTYGSMSRFRLTSIDSETGADTQVTYNPGICNPANPNSPPDPSTNDSPCFPQRWAPGDLGGTDPTTTSWFYKYTVAEVVTTDSTGGEPGLVTSYVYCATAACPASTQNLGAAWHYDTDIDLVQAKDKSWAQWRGYQYVHVITGAQGDTQSETDYMFLRGMSGDPVPDSGGGFDYPVVTVTPSDVTGTTQTPATVTDSSALSGYELEKVVIGPGGAQVSDQVTWPWTAVAATTANQQWGAPLTAMLTGTAETDTYTPLSAGGTRQTQSLNTYDTTTGLLLQVNDLNDLSVSSQAVCTTYAYPSPPSQAGLLDYPAEVQSVAGACPGGAPALVADTNAGLLSDTKYSYDGLANGTAPVSGNITETDVFASADSTVHSAHWVTQSEDTYDSYGRVTSSQNAKGFTTTTSYTSSYAAGYATTSRTVTSPLSCSTPTSCATESATTAINPEWGTTATFTDPDNEVTTYRHDPLGRVTAEWLPAEPTSGPASYLYSYVVLPTQAPAVTTQHLVNAAGKDYSTSVTLYDSLLRPRQTQTSSDYSITEGGAVVTDTYYDSRGNAVTTDGPFWACPNPNPQGQCTGPTASLYTATNESGIPDRTVSSYDEAGRIVSSDLFSGNTKKWGTSWAYNGADEVTETPPPGGTITSTFTDALGRSTQIDQYHSKTSASGDYDATAYTYNSAGQLASVTDPGGNHWAWTYNLAGQPITASDPDTGLTSTGYNDLGQVTTVADGAGHTISYSYDGAGRKTGEFASTNSTQNSGNQLAAWTYDTAAMTGGGTATAYGLLASATSYVGGTGGEAYIETINSYDQADHQTSAKWTIPKNAVTGALGGTGTATSATYAFGDTYNPDGSLATETYPQAGGLDAETVTHNYDPLGLPTITSSDPVSYDVDYATATHYSPLNQLSELNVGTMETGVPWSRADYLYDQTTQQLSQLTISRQSNNWAADSNIIYAYDDAGNLIAASDTATSQYQCYAYNYLSWLTAAWSQDTACPASPSTPPAPYSGTGVPAPYEQTISYDAKGQANGSTNGTTGTITSSTLITGTGATQDTTATSDSYPAYGAAQPHAPTQQTTTINNGTPATENLSWATQQSGYLTGITAGGTTTASYNWDGTGAAPGQLATATTGTGSNAVTTNYRYDASGNLLIVQDGATSTLYLPGEELTATGTTINATRYYTHAGQIIAARTTPNATLWWLFPNPQGTTTARVNTSNQDIFLRYFTPYGTPAGKVPWWPGTRGYVGGTTDAATGLTNLGAREYNPATPAFISPDPVLNPYSPADLDPYSYAYNNPATNEDPTGQVCAPGASSNANCNDPSVQKPPPPTYTYITGNILVSTTSLPGLVHAIAKAVKQIGLFFYPGGDMGTFDINDPQYKYAIAQKVCASHPNWCAQFPLPGQSEWGTILQTMGMILLGGVGDGEDGEPVPEPGSLSPLEARQFYLAGERNISARAAELAASGVDPELRANILFFMRNDLRTQARDLMANRQLAEGFEVSDPNMSWEEAIAKYKARGLSGDDLWNAISDAASRSRASVNKFFGLEP